MATLKSLENEIQKLGPEELAKFRDWFLQFDWEAWDRELERDIASGKLDELGKRVLEDHAAGKTTPL